MEKYLVSVGKRTGKWQWTFGEPGEMSPMMVHLNVHMGNGVAFHYPEFPRSQPVAIVHTCVEDPSELHLNMCGVETDGMTWEEIVSFVQGALADTSFPREFGKFVKLDTFH